MDDIQKWRKEKELELLRKMMEYSKAEKERLIAKQIAEEDSYGKFKAEQERIREAMVDAHLRRHEERSKTREAHPDWGGFS